LTPPPLRGFLVGIVRGANRMKPLVILAVLLAASAAAAQTVRQQPPPPGPQQPQGPQGPLRIDPKIPLNLDGSPTVPAWPGTPGSTGLRLPNSDATLMPSLRSPPTPDAMPPDRRQENVPTLRLRVPL